MPETKSPVDTVPALKEIFGFHAFRPNQEEIIQAVLEMRDVFAVMPTGGGKSLCYQLPAHLMKGTCLVISPLISLMKDQVDAAVETGQKAAYLNSSLSQSEKSAVMQKLSSGSLDLIYVAPERFSTESFLRILDMIDISFAAIDEAHCISEWGHDFRPDYLSLAIITQRFPHVPVAAFTATATRRVQEDIIFRLSLRNPLVVRASFNRPNLFYRVVPRNSANRQILQFLKERKNEAGIIYRTTRKAVEKTADFLKRRGIRALPYHAGLADETRKINQEAFNKDEIQVIVATIAFGMGIDKSNVRFILHGDLPKNMEGYYQETGRAGRDGEPAECLLLFSRGDIPKIRYFIEQMEDEGERSRSLKNLHTMAAYADVNACRRRQILAYFDERYPEENCGTCDVCTGTIEKTGATVDAQKALSAMASTGQRFGAMHIVDIVTGADTQKVRSLGHHKLKTYGAGQDQDKRYWRGIIDDLLAQEFIAKTGGQYPTLYLTEKASGIISGSTEFFTLRRKEKKRAQKRTIEAAKYPSSLFERLRGLRLSLARKKGVPPYVVFSDKTLREMAAVCPTTNIDLLSITGVGAHKLKHYGKLFLDEIAAFTKSGEHA
jgi:ATP-dependent DNA helicase RecQ